MPYLDALGDHRAPCPTAGVLGTRGAALERAAARVCREAGARVATNVLLREMNVDVPLTTAAASRSQQIGVINHAGG